MAGLSLGTGGLAREEGGGGGLHAADVVGLVGLHGGLLLGTEGTEALQFSGTAVHSADGPLYSTNPPHGSEVRLCAIPYALWQNRGASSMQVFLLTGA